MAVVVYKWLCEAVVWCPACINGCTGRGNYGRVYKWLNTGGDAAGNVPAVYKWLRN